MTARRFVGALSYTAEQVWDLRRRLRQAENQRDVALAERDAARAECERLRAAVGAIALCLRHCEHNMDNPGDACRMALTALRENGGAL